MSTKEYLIKFEKDTPICVGIDEAGRGPVLGPMVYSAAFCNIENKNSISKFGFAGRITGNNI